jgi:O-antigen/teichoic acid export membrane protein
VSRIRALAKESLIYGVSSIASRFLNFLLVPFYTHVMAPAEFGVLNIVLVVTAFLGVVYQFGFDSAYLRMGADAEGADRKRLFSTAVMSQGAIAALLSLLLVLLARPVGTAMAVPDGGAVLFRWAALVLLLDTLAVVPFAHLRLTHSALNYSLLKLANVLVNIGANLYFVLHLRLGVEGVMMAYVAASAATVILCLPVLLANLRPALDSAGFRQLLKFGLPLVPAGLWYMIIEMTGRIVLSRLSQADIDRLYPGSGYDTLALTGIFSASLKLGVFGLLLVQMYRMAWVPFFLQRHKDADAPRLFGRILAYFAQFVGYASVTLMVFLDYLVAVPILGRPLIHEAYWAGLGIVPVVLLAYAIEAWAVHFHLGVYIRKDTRFFVFSNGAGAAVTVAGNLLLVPILGLWGAALSACLCYLTIAVLVTRRSQRLFPIELRPRALFPILLWLALGWALGTAVQMDPDRWPMAWRLAGLLLFWVLPLLLGFFPRAELFRLFAARGRNVTIPPGQGKDNP